MLPLVDGEDFYSVDDAARILKLTPGRIRQMLRAGELEVASSPRKRWLPTRLPESRAFYDRKRAEGKRHTQALIALSRRMVNVLRAMLRDGTTFETRSAA